MGYSPWGCKESDTTEQFSQIKSKRVEKNILCKYGREEATVTPNWNGLFDLLFIAVMLLLLSRFSRALCVTP